MQRIREVTDRPAMRAVLSHNHANYIYGLQAFKEHGGAPSVLAQRRTLGYAGGTSASQDEDAARRLEQRRYALLVRVDEKTFIVAPKQVLDQEITFEMCCVQFAIRYLGLAHARGDAVMRVRNCDVLFGGRVPFLDSPETERWLAGLDYFAGLAGRVRNIVPGRSTRSEDPRQRVEATRDFILFVRDAMARAVGDFVPFDGACRNADGSRFENLPAFDASDGVNTCRIHLEE